MALAGFVIGEVAEAGCVGSSAGKVLAKISANWFSAQWSGGNARHNSARAPSQNGFNKNEGRRVPFTPF